MKKWLLTSILVFACTHAVHAQVVIDEIMYDVAGPDSGREWIEVANIGHESFDFTKWKIFENETNHAIKSFKGTEILSPESIAVIADNPQKFLADHPNYPGILFESAFSLSNEGETIGLKDTSLHLAHEISYAKDAGAQGDGNSFQKVAGIWYAAAPTPGLQNEKNAVKPVVAIAPQTTMSASIAGEKTTGSAMIFTPAVTDEKGNAITTGKIVWNFGDGNTKTTPAADAVEHTYQFAGTYAVVLLYNGITAQVPLEITEAPAVLAEKITTPEKIEIAKIQSPAVPATASTAPITHTASNTNLAASAVVGADAFHLSWWIFALAGLVFLCAAIAILFLKKPAPTMPEDDFEIIE